MTVIHGSFPSSVVALIVFVWMGALKLSVMDTSDLQHLVNEMILECLTLAKIPIKEAAALAGLTETAFRNALSGEKYRHISLFHLLQLPYRFWLHFGPALMWAVAKKHANEIAETFSMKRSA